MKQLQRIVLLTNILTPYRTFFYERFYEACKERDIDFKVLLMAETEPERNWYYTELKTEFSILMPGYNGSIRGFTYHYNPKVMNFLRNLKPDILLMAGSYMFQTNWVTIIKRKSLSVPIVYWNEAHLNEERNYSKLVLALRDKVRNIIFPCFSGYWYSGKMSLAFIDKYKCNDARCYFMPNLIDCTAYSSISKASEIDKMTIRKQYNLPLDKKLLICPARLHPAKGIHVFMDILKNVKGKENVCVIVPGDGGMLEKLQEKAKILNLDFRFLGYKQQEEIIKLYIASDIFLMPSLSDPNPLTTIEALWGGMPLIISKHVGNYPEAVVESINGIVMDYSDIDAAVRKVEKILGADKQWLIKAKETSLNIASLIYNPDVIIGTVISDMKTEFENGLLGNVFK